MPPFPTSFILLGQGWHFEWRFPGELGKGCADVKCNGSCEGWGNGWGKDFSAPKGPWGPLFRWLHKETSVFFCFWQGAFEKILASWIAERGGEVPAISENIDGYGCFRLNVLLEGANLHPVFTSRYLACDVLFSRLWLWACRPLIFVAGATFYASSGSVCVLQWSQLWLLRGMCSTW